MEIDKIWRIEWMKAVPQTSGVENVVVECGWRCILQQDDISATAYGSASFSIPENIDGTFTPFDQLTEQQVLGWVWDGRVDREEMEKNLTRQLEEKINPTVIPVTLPWSQAN